MLTSESSRKRSSGTRMAPCSPMMAQLSTTALITTVPTLHMAHSRIEHVSHSQKVGCKHPMPACSQPGTPGASARVSCSLLHTAARRGTRADKLGARPAGWRQCCAVLCCSLAEEEHHQERQPHHQRQLLSLTAAPAAASTTDSHRRVHARAEAARHSAVRHRPHAAPSSQAVVF